MNKLITSIILLLLAACSRDLTATRDFDRVCQAFEALSQEDGLDAMLPVVSCLWRNDMIYLRRLSIALSGATGIALR